MTNKNYFLQIASDAYNESFINKEIISKTLKKAEQSYVIAFWLNILIFIIGAGLVITGIILGFRNSNNYLPVFFTGFGSTSLVVLLLIRPVERVQSAVNKLIQSQVACLGYLAQYDSMYIYLAANANLFKPEDESYLDKQLKCAKFIQESTSQLINDLNVIQSKNIDERTKPSIK